MLLRSVIADDEEQDLSAEQSGGASARDVEILPPEQSAVEREVRSRLNEVMAERTLALLQERRHWRAFYAEQFLDASRTMAENPAVPEAERAGIRARGAVMAKQLLDGDEELLPDFAHQMSGRMFDRGDEQIADYQRRVKDLAARITVPPEGLKRVRQALRSYAEEGSYINDVIAELLRLPDVEMLSKDALIHFTAFEIIERFETVEAYADHLTNPHVALTEFYRAVVEVFGRDADPQITALLDSHDVVHNEKQPVVGEICREHAAFFFSFAAPGGTSSA